MKNRLFKTQISQISNGLRGSFIISLFLLSAFFAQTAKAEDWQWKIESDVTTTTIGSNIIFTTYANSSSTWEITPNTGISINNQIYSTGENGQYTFNTTATGTVLALVIDPATQSPTSSEISVEVFDLPTPPPEPTPTPESPATMELSTTTVHLQLSTYNATLYNDNFIVTACTSTNNSTTTALTPYCALSEVATQNNWNIIFSDYGGQKFLSTINNYDGTDGNWWAFFHNLDFAVEALNQYPLSTTTTENILLSYGIFPLKLNFSSTTPLLNTTTTITINEFGFDASWNSGWLPSNSSTLIINGQEIFSPSSNYDLYINSTGTFSVYVTKPGFINSQTYTINPTGEATNSTTTDQNFEGSGSDNSGSGGTNNSNNPPTPQNYTNPIDKAIDYLIKKQESSGAIGGALLSDWTAMAFKNYQGNMVNFLTAKELLKTYIQNTQAEIDLLGKERKTLALYALNGTDKNKYINFIQTQLDAPTNLSVGELIFGVLSLKEAGCCQTTINNANVELKKRPMDFFDYYGQAIKALRQSYDSNDETIKLYRSELLKNLKSDGSIQNNPDTTSWSMEGIAALNELSLGDWYDQTKINNPYSYLLSHQNSDGSFNNANSNQIMSTDYAILALSYNWQPVPNTNNNSASFANQEQSPTSTPSTTLDLATSTPITTPEVSTTTIEAVSSTSSTIQTPITNNLTPTTADDVKSIVHSDYQTETKKLRNLETIANQPSTTVQQFNNTTILPLSASSTPYQETARGVFATATTLASGLGIFLAWRLLQTLI